MGGEGDRTGSARGLLVRYLKQMQELGESEIYLSPDVREALMRSSAREASSSASAPRTAAESGGGTVAKRGPEPVSSGDAVRSPSKDAASRRPAAGSQGGDRAVRSGKRPAAELAAEIPEPEVIQATLAVSRGSATSDMFTESSSLYECSSLEEMEKLALACERCELSQGRTKVVFGAGNPNATLMFVGEAPGRDEDLSGIPFVGRAGQLLDKILAAADIARDNVYIGNIIKCRPPNNRTPLTSEIDACMPYLERQIRYIRPSVICPLGLPATQTLLGLRGSMGSLRGKIYKAGDIVVVPTYHPAAALRDPKYKKPIWEDFLIVKREYDRAGGNA